MWDVDSPNEMLPLYLLGAHAAGDFPLQTDEMAANKFDSAFVRAKHVTSYSLPFVGATALSEWSTKQRVVFLLGNWLTHFAIDTKRWKEPTEGFESFPVWYDQALHVVALSIMVALTETLSE